MKTTSIVYAILAAGLFAGAGASQDKVFMFPSLVFAIVLAIGAIMFAIKSDRKEAN